MVGLLNSCISVYEVYNLTYNNKQSDDTTAPINTINSPSTDCYSETIKIIETSFPAKPELKDDDEVSKVLLDSLQVHRQFIRESINKMKHCHK